MMIRRRVLATPFKAKSCIGFARTRGQSPQRPINRFMFRAPKRARVLSFALWSLGRCRCLVRSQLIPFPSVPFRFLHSVTSLLELAKNVIERELTRVVHNLCLERFYPGWQLGQNDAQVCGCCVRGLGANATGIELRLCQ
jgi:hypothetical protein